MHLTGLDWAVVAAFFAINIAIGVFFARRTSGNVGEYFLSGRSVPWWLAGTSMVATTFAVDTPLAVTGLVAQDGIAGNWLWWNMALSGLLTVFFFSALWRRSGVLTDVEFTELRYGGRPATALRGVRAVYQGIIVNTIVMGWVNLAMIKVLSLTLAVPTSWALAVCLILTAVYVTIGGLWSVLWSDLLQFVVKMTMAIVLAIAAVAAVGGVPALRASLAAIDAHHAGGGSLLAFVPGADSAWMPLSTFLVFLGVSWWASSYPGAEPGGGSYIAQRIFAARSERDATFATLFFNVAHYALRPWPWILVALCALVLYPHGVAGPSGKIDPELGYVQVMVDHLPASLRGLMMAGFLAAFMSTIGTQLNLGASYLTNDLYRRFIRQDASEPHYVAVSRLMTIVALILAALVTLVMTSVADAWKYLLTLTAGVGPVMILRWYWWRINAWSEIVALATSAVAGSALYLFGIFPGDDTPATAQRLLVVVAVTTVAWLTATFVTAPESAATLERFYMRVRPSKAGWRPVAANLSAVPGSREDLGVALIDWLAGIGLIFGTLFGIGKLVLGEPLAGLLWIVLAVACGALIARNLLRPAPPRAVAAAVATALALCLCMVPRPAAADADKVLTNVKGKVAYERSGAPQRTLVPTASIAMANGDIAQTEDASQARVTLPDSSRVTIGSSTKVEMSFFDQKAFATAKFVVYEGKTRFDVQHPAGAKADYTFTTPTTNIAVRGTEGDIGVDGDDLTLNVYASSDPRGVQVTFTKGDKAGSSVFVKAGQQLVVQLVNGLIQQNAAALTQGAIDQFNDLGVPTNAQAALDLATRSIDDAVEKAKSKIPSFPGRPF